MIPPALLGTLAIKRSSSGPELPNPAGPPLPWDYWHNSTDSYDVNPCTLQPDDLAGTNPAIMSISANDTLYAMPFFVGRLGRIITKLGSDWTTAPSSGSVMKFGIYSVLPPSAHDIYPKNLLTSVEFSLSGTTGYQSGLLPSPLVLENGLYWIAFARKSGASATSMRCSSGGAWFAGRNPLGRSNAFLSISLANATALPSVFGAGAAIVTTLPSPLIGVE